SPFDPLLSLLPPTPRSTRCPYTTLFRSTQRPQAMGYLVFKGGLCAAAHARPLHAFSMCKVASRQYIFRFNHLTDSFDPGIKLKRSEEHTSELQSRFELVCRLLLEKKKRR